MYREHKGDVNQPKAKHSRPPLKNFAESVYMENVYTSTNLPLTTDKPLLYIVPGLKNYLIDLSLIKHYARFRIVDSEGANLTASDECVVKGSPLYSAFKQLHVTWNQTTVFDAKNMYNQYVNFLQKTKDLNILPTMIEYYDDTSDMLQGVEKEFDPADPTKVVSETSIWDGADSITEWNNRIGSWRHGNEIETIGPLLFDQVFQNKFLRDDIEMRITFYPAHPELALFTTLAEKKFRLELVECHLVVPRFKLLPRYTMSRGNLQYYYVRHELSTHVLPSGAQTVQRQLKSGIMPRRVYLVMVTEDAFLGSYHHTPFKYQPFKLNYFQITCGNKKFPTEPMRMMWGENTRIAEAFQWFLINTRSSKRLANGGITKGMFERTDHIIAVDLTSDLSAGSDYRVEPLISPLSLQMQFDEALPTNVIIIMIEEFESSVNVSSHGQVSLKEFEENG